VLLRAGRGHVGAMDWRAATRIDHAQIILQSEDAPMTFPGTMFHCTPQFSRTAAPRSGATGRRRGRIALLGLPVLGLAVAAAALATRAVPPASAQITPPPTPPTVGCRSAGQDLIMPPEIVSSGGVLKGIVTLTEEFQRLPPVAAADKSCAQQLLRAFRCSVLRGECDRSGIPPLPPPDAPPVLVDPVPGPTMRAKVGDLVQLSFVNAVDANRFDRNVVLGADGCMQVGQGGSIYPGGPPASAFDKFPNCLHASATANIHYHGTHTNPNSTGDNVFLQIIPLPRDNQGTLTTTPEQAMAGLEPFFQQCALRLRNPLNQWPAIWKELTNNAWLAKQKELLMDYQNKNPGQRVWDEDMKADDGGSPDGSWPQYYIGAVPYCFALPAYTADIFPPPPGSSSPIMGQAPGTHWYHAHKHGSTAINVMDGMTGAFIIEGQYDADLNKFYGGYMLKGGAWNTRSQPVLVLNQLGSTPNLLMGGPSPIPPFVVNALTRPIQHMQPGEVQLWRIVNTSARNAAYFMAPEGFQWRQLAQDGVQFARETYASPQNQNRPFYLAPANRVDLLVQAPMTPVNADVLIQAVNARSLVKPTPLNPNPTDPNPGAVLMSVSVSGDPVPTPDGKPMPFPPEGRAPVQPKFLTDITDKEWSKSNYAKREFTFDSKRPMDDMQHTINDHQFDDGPYANVPVKLGNVEEWKIINRTNTTTGPRFGPIDHPFHIHINPFQITEVFDPNENLVDPSTGKLLAQLVNGKTQPVPRYVTNNNQKSSGMMPDGRTKIADLQCVLDPNNESTWSVAGACGPQPPQSNLIWWDVFAIPSARVVPNTKIVIPGYFKMRSRFVDYYGDYVMHCHILAHEDRGMMFTVEVTPEKQLAAGHQHH
jgi:FtsP/CotA-like multicopper oxidase with cupredoxin domain